MEEETAEDDRKTGDLSINYTAMATRDARRNSMQRRSNMRRSRARGTRSVWRRAHKKSNISNWTEGSDGGESEPTQRPLKHDPGRQQGSLPATLCLHTCLSTCQLCISHGWCSRGAGSVPTHFDTEALWVGMRRRLCGQGPVWVSQHRQAYTCPDFYHKAPQAQHSMSPAIAVPLSLWELGIWEWERGGGASVPRNEK